jgi:hypothetical protein
MSITLLLLWALLGWTGVIWPPQLPPPPPPPDPRWFSTRLVNMIGAVVGGIIWNWTWPVGAQQSPGLGAVVGAALASDIAWLLFWQGKKTG